MAPKEDLTEHIVFVLRLLAYCHHKKKKKKVEDTWQKINEISAYASSQRTVRTNPFTKGDLVKLLHKCLVNHRFESALILLEPLALESQYIEHLIFMTAFQVIENFPNSLEVMKFFMRTARDMGRVLKREVVLEFLMYLFRKGEFSYAKTYLQKDTQLWHHSVKKHPVIDALIKGYNGMLDYIEWKKAKIRATNLEEQGFEATNDTALMEMHGTSAITLLKDAISEDGVWDIFILKLIELLEHYQCNDEALDVLERYTDYKDDHLNAYIYLYEFLKKHNLSPANQLYCLQNIAQLSPSNKRVLDYIALIRNGGFTIEKKYATSIRLLLDFVDYPCNKENLEAWCLLARIISESLKLGYQDDLNALWKTRKSYWPVYHFNPRGVVVNSRKEAKLLIAKTTVCKNLKFDSHSYLEAVTLSMKKSEYSEKYTTRLEHLGSPHKRIRLQSLIDSEDIS